jgi:hypothetical protein
MLHKQPKEILLFIILARINNKKEITSDLFGLQLIAKTLSENPVYLSQILFILTSYI